MDTDVQAPEAAAPEDEAVWSRAWEWPAWLRALGRAGRGGGTTLRGWRPDPRTLAVLLAIMWAPRLAQAIPVAREAWQALTYRPVGVDAQFLASDPALRWERVATASFLGELLSAALVLPAVALLLAMPRRLPGFVVAAAGVLLYLATEVALLLAVFHLYTGSETRTSYVANAGGAVATLAFVVYVGVQRQPERRG